MRARHHHSHHWSNAVRIGQKASSTTNYKFATLGTNLERAEMLEDDRENSVPAGTRPKPRLSTCFATAWISLANFGGRVLPRMSLAVALRVSMGICVTGMSSMIDICASVAAFPSSLHSHSIAHFHSITAAFHSDRPFVLHIHHRPIIC